MFSVIWRWESTSKVCSVHMFPHPVFMSILFFSFWYWYESHMTKTNQKECNLKEISLCLFELRSLILVKILLIWYLLCSSLKFTQVHYGLQCCGSSCAHSFPNCKGTNLKMDNEQYAINNSSLINPLTTCKHKNIYNNNIKLCSPWLFGSCSMSEGLWLSVLASGFTSFGIGFNAIFPSHTPWLTHTQTHFISYTESVACSDKIVPACIQNGNIVWVIPRKGCQ